MKAIQTLLCLLIIFHTAAVYGQGKSHAVPKSKHRLLNQYYPILNDTSVIKIDYKDYSDVSLSPDARKLLQDVAQHLDTASIGRIIVSGGPASSSFEQQRNWDRVNNVIQYFSKLTHLQCPRFIFLYESEYDLGVKNSVVIRLATEGETGTCVVPPPHPNIRDTYRPGPTH